MEEEEEGEEEEEEEEEFPIFCFSRSVFVLKFHEIEAGRERRMLQRKRKGFCEQKTTKQNKPKLFFNETSFIITTKLLLKYYH